jgi:cysteine-rich repeat protein
MAAAVAAATLLVPGAACGPGSVSRSPPRTDQDHDDQPFCGDRAINQATEECDDGNENVGDGCNGCRIERAPRLVVGDLHSCALLASGGVKCWGDDLYGQLGNDAEELRQSAPAAVQGLANGVVALAAGAYHTCAISAGGALACWGQDSYGQLGDDATDADQPTPVPVAGMTSGVLAVACGESFTCAVVTGGEVRCWGREPATGTIVRSPALVPSLSGVTGLTAGQTHACAVKADHNLVCWGDNNDGQLGNGDTGTMEAAPVSVVGLDGMVEGVSAGRGHTCAVTTAGAALCWGSNSYQQLGSATATGVEPQPVPVDGLSSGVVRVAAARRHTCARLASGAVQCWGSDDTGQLGDGRPAHSQSSPVAVIELPGLATSVATGDRHTCVGLVDGAAHCFGAGAAGQLGDGTSGSADRPIPVPVAGVTSGAVAVSAGTAHTCVLTTTGGVRCWGAALGIGDGRPDLSASRLTPTDALGLASGVVAVVAGDRNTCALTTTGGMKCWGEDTYGQLGDGGANLYQLAPVDVAGLTSGVVAMSSPGQQACAVTSSGGARCWGRDYSGQLGDGGTNANQAAPVDVTGLTSGAAAIEAGGAHVCAVLGTGGLRCWGADSRGQLGDGGANADQSTPADVVGLASGVAAVTTGDEHTCALTTAGGVKCWGSDLWGALGNGGADEDQTTPADVSDLASGVAAISAGAGHTCALSEAGGVKCWGSNNLGQLGNGGAATSASTPTDVSGLTSGVVAIAAGGVHTCALLTDGSLRCWGSDDSGQLGDDLRWAGMCSALPVQVLLGP